MSNAVNPLIISSLDTVEIPEIQPQVELSERDLEKVSGGIIAILRPQSITGEQTPDLTCRKAGKDQPEF
jgi:hypothetical protein